MSHYENIVCQSLEHTFALSTPPGVSGLAMDSWILVSRFVVELSSLAILASAFLCNKPLELRMLKYHQSDCTLVNVEETQ